MDGNTLANIFNTAQDGDLSTQLDHLMDDSLVRVQSAVIALEHFKVLSKIYQTKSPFIFDKSIESITLHSYNKIYSFIAAVDIEELSQKCFTLYPDELLTIVTNLKTLLSFFETQEDYLKCARIKNILDILSLKEVVVCD